MPEPNAYGELEPVASTTEAAVQVLQMRMKIRNVSIDRPSIVHYFRNIPADKQEIALVHAIEVGIAELSARRERVKR
jgi:hypothetical protein